MMSIYPIPMVLTASPPLLLGPAIPAPLAEQHYAGLESQALTGM